jgi:hypothetical protein
MKTISPVCDEESTAYVSAVMNTMIRGIELVARMVAHNDVCDESSRSPTLPEASCLLNRCKKLKMTL